MWAGILGNLNSLFLVGDMVKGASDYIQKKPWGKDIQFGPLDHFYDRIWVNIIDLAKGLSDKKIRSAFLKAVKNLDTDYLSQDKKIGVPLTKLLTAIPELRGIPLETILKWMRNVYKVGTGDTKSVEEAVMRILNSSDYFIPGSKTKSTRPKASGKTTRGYKTPVVSKGGYKSKAKNKSFIKKNNYKSPVKRR